MLDPGIRSLVAGKYNPLYIIRREEEQDIVREVKHSDAEDRSSVEKEKHDEYIIRISQNHKANELRGTSVLEQSILADTDLNIEIVLKLIGIVQKNRIAADAAKGIFQPIFLRLDAPVSDSPENKRKAELYQDLFNQLTDTMTEDKRIREFQESVKQEKIIIVKTMTRGHYFYNKLGESLRTRILREGESLVQEELGE
jgi:hypothetical protein